uniref:Uncharacterized protein n=1 Tax=Pristionchus pacificus TaxID=54126 RepID=A0A2A6BR37_PRIPA|eukprot:PDM68253.1 hypothetical protein PRIPAC_46297 [Pristionchus pacificus]
MLAFRCGFLVDEGERGGRGEAEREEEGRDVGEDWADTELLLIERGEERRHEEEADTEGIVVRGAEKTFRI